VATNPLNQPPPLDQPALPSGWASWDPTPPAGPHPHPTQRHHGTASHQRHQGVVHHPHAQSLAAHHHLSHPHQAAAARHRQPGGRHHATTLRHTTRSHAREHPRLGPALVELGVLVSVNTGTNQAYVRLYGSQASVIGPLGLGLGLASYAAVGKSALVILLDQSNPTDAIIAAVF
jgi:hypothetical protein